MQRRAGVEADIGIGLDQRIVGEARVLGRVRNMKDARLQDGVAAKRDRARCFGSVQSMARLEPLAVCINQRDHRHAHAEELRGNPRDAVEPLIGRSVEQVQPAQSCKPSRLVFGNCRFKHGYLFFEPGLMPRPYIRPTQN